ncbi:hypothetical protein [Xanthomonas phage DES1]|nr:hypothetical protein [Xanthomonas phage DES1]
MKALALIVLCMATAGCVHKEVETPQLHGTPVPQAALIGLVDGAGLYVFNDNENGVVCHMVTRYHGTSISCVPMQPYDE